MNEQDMMNMEQPAVEQKKPPLDGKLANAHVRSKAQAQQPKQTVFYPPVPMTAVEAKVLDRPVNPPEKSEAPRKERKARKKLNRTERMEFRVTVEERKWIDRQAEKGHWSQGEYLRQKVLHDPLQKNSAKTNTESIVALDKIRAELGRVGGLLKSAIKPNEGSANITREEWEMVFQAIRDLEALKTAINLELTKRASNEH